MCCFGLNRKPRNVFLAILPLGSWGSCRIVLRVAAAREEVSLLGIATDELGTGIFVGDQVRR